MADIVFYTNPMSRGRIVRWMLEEVGAPYETRLLDYATTMKAPEYLAINPMGKVPALVHDGVVVTEAAAICAWLADAFPEADLAPPPGSRDRGPYYRWMFFGAGPVEGAVTDRSFGLTPDTPDLRRRAGYGSVDHVADALAALLGDGRPYALGERFSAVDVYLGSQITWGVMFHQLPDRPPFADYVARLASRPAAVRAREIDDALSPKDAAAT